MNLADIVSAYKLADEVMRLLFEAWDRHLPAPHPRGQEDGRLRLPAG